MTRIEQILCRDELSREDLVALLSTQEKADLALIQVAAERTLLQHCGDVVNLRGLIEFSNCCTMDCDYCGIRRSNGSVERFTLNEEEILSATMQCLHLGYGSLVLQSGERRDSAFVEWLEATIRLIKERTRCEKLPQGLGITLSVGEQSHEILQRFFKAGAHRYLLRIETSNPVLFAAIHPPSQRLESRVRCLEHIKEIGFQVGCGVMIGLPGQTTEMLADDLLFLKKLDVDMIGMGPYIPHPETPLGKAASSSYDSSRTFSQSLLMIAAARLLLKDVNIASTTALQAMDETGREKGLRHGANVIMPQVSPMKHRGDYLLYPGKPCIADNAADCAQCLAARISSTGRRTVPFDWGDSRHFSRRTKR